MPAIPAATAPAPGADAATTGETAETSTEATAETAADVAEPKPEDKPDAETARRLDMVQKETKRQRELIAKERADAKAEVDRMRAEIQPHLDALKKFEDLRARAKYNPAGVLAELGLTEDDFEPAARDIYARSKAAAADPKTKDAALRMQLEREQRDQVAATQKQVADLQAKIAEKEQQAQYQEAWRGYYGDVVKLASAETSPSPLLRNAIAKNAPRAEQAIQTLAAQIHQETGEWPDASDVAARFEAVKRAELAELGIDAAPVNANKPKPAPATEAAPARTLANDMAGSTTIPKAAKTRQEQRAETLRLMESGKTE